MLEVGFEGTGRVMGGGLRFSVRATDADFLDASPFGSIAELDFVSVGGGIAQISSDTTDYDTEAVNVGLEIGLRLQLKKFLLSGGYLAQSDEYAESDPENFSFVEETTWQFEGLFLMLGVRW